MSDETNRRQPCGNCDIGTYAAAAIVAGVGAFRSCESTKAALQIAPRCRLNGLVMCAGARDFIVAMDWPIDPAAIMEALNA